VTIREIARMTGVSTQTVSRVINNRPDVSPATRAAIETAIAEVGFQPSEVARSLVHRRSQTLGVIVAGLRFFGISQTLNGITDESENAGYGLLLKEINRFDTADIVPVVEFLAARRVEGIIYAAPHVGMDVGSLRSRLPASTPPMVLLKSPPTDEFTTIGIDNYGGARRATEHLIALRRRRIGHVTGPLDWLEARDRQRGWHDALAAAGRPTGPVEEGSWSSASGEAAFERMLASDPEIDGVFAANDQMALGILRVAHLRGIAVPGQVAVVGFDGLPESAQFVPSLTTIVQPLPELGGLAVRQLLAHFDAETGHGHVDNIVLKTEMVIRESAPAVEGG
jgi:LacI family transcriptional regulator